MDSIHKGDNTAAFGKNFISIEIENPENVIVSKLIFKVGCISKENINPTAFPWLVNITSAETAKLNYINVGYLEAYDELGRGEECEGCIVFKVKNGVFCDVNT